MTMVQRNDLVTQILRSDLVRDAGTRRLGLLKNAIPIVRLLLPLGRDRLHQDGQASFGGSQNHSSGAFQGHGSEKFGSAYCLGDQQACATVDKFQIYLR
jgi:hypothetical protein